MKNFELTRNIIRKLIRKRKEIEKMKSGRKKIQAMKVYAQLLTNLELGNAS